MTAAKTSFPRLDLSLEGKIALITGSSRGIGESIAHLFAAHGADVILVSRKQADLDVVAEKINARDGGRAHAIAAHMGKMTDIQALLDELKTRNLSVDILVNNAGISPSNGKPLVDTTEALWDKVMEVNLKGPFFLTAALGKQMAERGGGSVVNISTTSALMSQPEIGTYCISKAGLNAMTRNFARELGPFNVRVNAISCGVIETVMGAHTLDDPERKKWFLQVSPIKRPGTPEEIAAAALMLASDATSYTTGAIIQADGGVIA